MPRKNDRARFLIDHGIVRIFLQPTNKMLAAQSIRVIFRIDGLRNIHMRERIPKLFGPIFKA